MHILCSFLYTLFVLFLLVFAFYSLVRLGENIREPMSKTKFCFFVSSVVPLGGLYSWVFYMTVSMIGSTV